MPKDRLLALDLVRGLCAVSVMVYHYFHHFDLASLYGFGKYGVYMFFILSGFAMHYVYGDRQIDEKMLRRFFIARVMRIAPLWILVVIFVMHSYPWNDHNIARFLLNITFMFGITNPGLHSAVVGGWSIGIEFAFYAVFPIMLLFRGVTAQALLLVAAMILRHYYMNDTMVHPSYPDGARWFQTHQLASFLAFFAAGTFGSTLYAKFRHELDYLVKHYKLGTVLTLASVGLLALVLCWPWIFDIPVRPLLIGMTAQVLIVMGGITIFVGALARPTGVLKFFSSWIGDISFAVYLFHAYVLRGLDGFVEARGWELHWGYVMGTAVAITFVLATLSYHFFEMPLRKFGYKLATGGFKLPSIPRPDDPSKRPPGSV